MTYQKDKLLLSVSQYKTQKCCCSWGNDSDDSQRVASHDGNNDAKQNQKTSSRTTRWFLRTTEHTPWHLAVLLFYVLATRLMTWRVALCKCECVKVQSCTHKQNDTTRVCPASEICQIHPATNPAKCFWRMTTSPSGFYKESMLWPH